MKALGNEASNNPNNKGSTRLNDNDFKDTWSKEREAYNKMLGGIQAVSRTTIKTERRLLEHHTTVVVWNRKII